MGYNVVIIDDEPWTRETIKSLGDWGSLELEIAGEASDGDFGLEIIKSIRPEIIITDINMPNMNGIQLISKVKELGIQSEVIIISGYDDFDYLHSALKLGVSDYLLKPIKPDELNKQLVCCIEKLEKNNVEYGKNSGILASVFLETPWVHEYNRLKMQAYENLFKVDEVQLSEIFCRIGDLLEKDQEDRLKKGNMICVYYSLMLQLQKYIHESGHLIQDFFNVNEAVFVFSQECTSQEMLRFILGLYQRANLAVQREKHSRSKFDISMVKKFIDDNYSGQITLEQTAIRFFISKEHLSKLFKASSGEGFIEYLTHVRMEKAKQLIAEQNIPIKDVGFMVGYVEQAHFYKRFKGFYGMTPGEMKGSLKIDNK